MVQKTAQRAPARTIRLGATADLLSDQQIVVSMALRQALSTLGRRGLAACGTLRLAPLAAASNAAATGWAPGSAASLLSRGRSAEAVAEREKKLPETSGWGSTLVGHLLKAKASAGRGAKGVPG